MLRCRSVPLREVPACVCAVAASRTPMINEPRLKRGVCTFVPPPPSCPIPMVAGKIVVDAMNYWPASDGVLSAFEDGSGSSEIVADTIRGAMPSGCKLRRNTFTGGSRRKSAAPAVKIPTAWFPAN